MILASDLGSGELFWFMLEFFLLFILILILFQVIGDLFRDHSMSGGVRRGGSSSSCASRRWRSSST